MGAQTLAGDLLRWGADQHPDVSYATCCGTINDRDVLLLGTQPKSGGHTWITDLPCGAELVPEDRDELLLRP